jgi:hypothetical protein
MDTTAWTVCSAFLSKAEGNKKSALLNYLSEEDREKIASSSFSEKNPLEVNFDVSDLFNRLHPSWIAPILRSFPESEVLLFLSCLPEDLQKKVKQSLMISQPLPILTPIAKKYLLSHLYEKLTQDDIDILPIELLPHSPLNTLIDMPVHSLPILIEYLGLHDLAVEMRQIIDTTQIKKIHSCLPEARVTYLKKLCQKKEPVLFRRMDLAKWDGKAESLHKVIYHRGLNRLSKALYAENHSLIWHLCRSLPWEDATVLQNLCKPLEHPKAANLLSHQILEITPLVYQPSSKENL